MKLAYLYSRYPVISQTFCDMEMLELERRGYELLIGSVHPPLTSLRHEHFDRFRPRFITRRRRQFCGNGRRKRGRSSAGRRR